MTVSTVDAAGPEEEDDDEDDDEDEDDPAAGGGGPTAVTRPGVVVPEGSWTETCWPTAIVGSFGVSGTETDRVVVVTRYGMSPGEAG